MSWGIDHGYPFILQMDADGSHRPVDLPKLLSRMAGPDRPDLVIGSRWVPGGAINGWSAKRVALSKAGNYYVRFCLGTPVRDATAGLRLHRAFFLSEHEVLGRVATTGFGFQVEMTELERSLGAAIAEVPITFDERMAGESKLDSFIFVEEPRDGNERRPEPTGPGRTTDLAEALALAVGALGTQPPLAVRCELLGQNNLEFVDRATLEQHVPVGTLRLDGLVFLVLDGFADEPRPSGHTCIPTSQARWPHWTESPRTRGH